MPNCPNRDAGERKIVTAILERPVIEKIHAQPRLEPRPPPCLPSVRGRTDSCRLKRCARSRTHPRRWLVTASRTRRSRPEPHLRGVPKRSEEHTSELQSPKD